MIVFNEVDHTYKNTDTDRYYTSVSKLLSLYKEPFDKDFFAERAARKQGVSKEEILEKWNKDNKTACDKGQNIHTIIENYIQTGEIGDQKLIDELNEVFDKDDFKLVRSEYLVWNDTFEIAGTSDMICDVNNDVFDVYDFKTNKKFLFENQYGKYLKAPLNNLQQCQFNDYGLQLSLYAYMYSGYANKKVRKICIFYHDGKKFHKYHVPYLYWEVSALLKHYSLNHGQQTIDKDKIAVS